MNTVKYNIIHFNDTCENSILTPYELYIKSTNDDTPTNDDTRRILCDGDGVVNFTGIIQAFYKETNETVSIYSFKNGFLHSYDGNPAEITPYVKKWYFDGNLHREDGPAIVYNSNETFKTSCIYFLHGIGYSIGEYLKRIPEENAILLSLQC